MWVVLGYIAAIILVSILISVFSNIKSNNEIRRRIENDWGAEFEEKYTEDDLKSTAEYFNNRKEVEKGTVFIDEITWKDLDMDSIFKKINNTESSPGEQYLYNILREPIYDEEKLKHRDELIKFFQNNDKERKSIQYILAKLGKNRACFITDYFYNKGNKRKSLLFYYRILSLIPFAGVGLIFLNPYIGLATIILSFSYNIFVYYKEKNKIKHKFESFMYILKIVKYAGDILKEDVKKFKDYNKKLKEALKELRSIKRLSFASKNNGTDVGIIAEYTSMFLLTDLINYEKMSNALMERNSEFKVIFEVIGVIDSCMSIAAYRRRIKNYVTPELTKCRRKQENVNVFKDIRHPLMEKSVPNSIEISDSILITGSNASGKSTFLKTVAINIILAETIYTCLASEFKCCYFKIYTSMALKDDIFSNESYYIVETKSLKRIIDNLNEDIPTICFVDEILRGTNTVERISASSQVLKYLTLNNCICIAATHDVELTHILERYFQNYHFQESIENNEIKFDYRIHEGRATTQNAIKLLGILGYSDAIVKKAQDKANKFLTEGIWEVE
ncbi:MutS-related protein [Clostridium coskatii]|uniref:DNA mismatch repair protein MutS n=1 Tax=Clostridium coskatii TaxID=1705578 RepID=A0A162L4Z0_9CLOT|nr:DNA mismatch repair protein MutS [Clostridium coskatii]OAA91172.1 DNA mismatch repair protein MutS [Clostridium coskatii]OBR90599.1 DNA mismatch repair protein MutS [Clostridium coskatii]